MKNTILIALVSTCLGSPVYADLDDLNRQCAQYRDIIPDNKKTGIDYSYTDGLLWKVEKDGRVNYLFGTMHTQDQRFTDIPPQVRIAMLHTRTYLNEVEQDQAANQIFVNSIYMDDDASLADHLHPELLGLLKFKAEKYDLDPDRVEYLQPWAAFSLIGRPPPTRALSLDQVLLNYAISRNHEVHALESMTELLQSLGSIPRDDQVEILKDTLCNHDQILKDSWELLQLYIHANLRGMVEFNAKPHHDEQVYQRFVDIMVNQRNQRMLERMLPWLQQGDTFVAVGATHLHGKEGLLSLLVDQGYVVEDVF